MPIQPKRKGFTLVELLVVIAIIGILSLIGFTVFSNITQKARDARRKGDIDAMVFALQNYKQNHDVYPDSIASTGRNGWGASDLNPTDYMGVNPSELFGTGSLPLDPLNNEEYHYEYQRFAPETYGCRDAYFFVIGIKKFEATPPIHGFSCPGKDFGEDFEFAVGNYE